MCWEAENRCWKELEIGVEKLEIDVEKNWLEIGVEKSWK